MRVSDPTEFGTALRDRRKQLGYTQNYLAEVSGFSASFISDLENGKGTAELGKSMQLASILGLNMTITERD